MNNVASAATHLHGVAAVDELAAGLRSVAPSVVFFFVGGGRDPALVGAGLGEAFPDAVVVGCTTCGEIGPSGCTDDTATALAIGAPCRAATAMVSDLRAFRFEDGAELVARLADDLGIGIEGLVGAPDEHVFVVFSDGLSGMEELLIASVATHAPGVGLVGGSAGDDFRFEATHVHAMGDTASNAATVTLLQPNVSFAPFHLHHYEPTDRSLVVTGAEPVNRRVTRLDGRAAPQVLAELMDLPLDRLLAAPLDELSKQPVVFGFRAGSSIFMRSVMNVEPEALLMGGALEQGAVIYRMAPGTWSSRRTPAFSGPWSREMRHNFRAPS